MDNQNYNLNYNANYNPSPASQPEQGGSKKPAIVAMVFGIVSIFLGCFPFVSIAGIVFGIIGRIKSCGLANSKVPYTYGFIKAGRICSLAGIIYSAIMTLLYIIILIEGAYYF